VVDSDGLDGGKVVVLELLKLLFRRPHRRRWGLVAPAPMDAETQSRAQGEGPVDGKGIVGNEPSPQAIWVSMSQPVKNHFLYYFVIILQNISPDVSIFFLNIIA